MRKIWCMRVCMFSCLVLLPLTTWAKSDWQYQQFPMLKPGKKLNYPQILKVGPEVLKPMMASSSGSHPIFGIDQAYVSQNFQRRILIKQNVKVSDASILGQWVAFRTQKAHIYHYREGSQIIALYVQGVSEGELKNIEKQFIPKNQRFNFSKTAMLWDVVNVECAQAQELGSGQEVGSGGRSATQSGVTRPSDQEQEAGESLARCLANKAGSELKNQAVGAYEATKGALSSVYDDPMGALRATGSFLYGVGESAVDGVVAGGSAVYNFGKDLYNDPEQIWKDINASMDRTAELGRKLYAELEQAIDGFADLDPAVRNKLICEFGGMVIADGAVGVVLGLTGAGTAVGVAKVVRLLNNFKNKLNLLMPVMRSLGNSGLTAAAKQDIVKELLDGKITKEQALARLGRDTSRDVSGKTTTTQAATQAATSSTTASATAADRAATLARSSSLSNSERLSAASEALGRDLTASQRTALLKAHEVGQERGAGYGTYTQAEISEKARILREAGFSPSETRRLMEDGLAGSNARAGSNSISANLERYREYHQRDPSNPDSARLYASYLEHDAQQRGVSVPSAEVLRLRNSAAAAYERNGKHWHAYSEYVEVGLRSSNPEQKQEALNKALASYSNYAKSPEVQREYARVKRSLSGMEQAQYNEATFFHGELQRLKSELSSSSNERLRQRLRTEIELIAKYGQSRGWNASYFSSR